VWQRHAFLDGCVATQEKTEFRMMIFEIELGSIYYKEACPASFKIVWAYST
jgi:hypothetical protein